MYKATIWDTAGKVKIFIIVVISPKFLAHHHNHYKGSVRYSLRYCLRHFEDEELYNNHHHQQLLSRTSLCLIITIIMEGAWNIRVAIIWNNRKVKRVPVKQPRTSRVTKQMFVKRYSSWKYYKYTFWLYFFFVNIAHIGTFHLLQLSQIYCWLDQFDRYL